MDTNEKQLDSLTSDAAIMEMEEQETTMEEEREASVGVAATMKTTSECPKTDRKPSAAVISRVTPSPEVAAMKRTLSDGSESETPWQERKMSAQSQGNIHSPTAVSPRNAASSMTETNEDDDPVRREAKRARTKPVPLGPLPMPSATQKESALRELKNPGDRALQIIIWDIGCRYTLLAHQPEAVRAVAGLPFSFPLRFPNAAEDSNAMSPNEVFRSFPIKSKTNGILVADEMVCIIL